MTAATGGLDVLVFTDGVAENSVLVRRVTTDRLAYLGVDVDARLNDDATPDLDISRRDAAVRTLVIGAREDLEIAAGVRSDMT